MGTNQLASRRPLRPRRNFDGSGRCPLVQVLPPADRADAGLEQSCADRPARPSSGRNRLPWIRTDITALLRQAHRLALCAFSGGDRRGCDLCGGSHFNAGIMWLQLSWIVAMGCLYGTLRLNYRSTAAAVLTHSTYNLVLCLSSWL